jgi:hypothetical protein
MMTEPSFQEHGPLLCKQCGGQLTWVARRTIATMTGGHAYTIEVWLCATCHCAYGLSPQEVSAPAIPRS